MSPPGYTPQQAARIKGQIETDLAAIEARIGLLARRVTDHGIDGGPGYFGAFILEELRERGRFLAAIVDRRTR